MFFNVMIMNCTDNTPCYIIEEEKLRNNLALIKKISTNFNVEIILALKAFANWKIFPIVREYVAHTTASSLYEARLSAEHFGGLTYSYSPAYEMSTINELLRYSEHITFNSLSQFYRFRSVVKDFEHSLNGHKVSMGLRINPEYSEIETELYNPCAPGSRFGVTSDLLKNGLPEGIEGLHFHCLCENNSTTLENVLENTEKRFGYLFPQVKWLNMGGGHLFTRKDYNLEKLYDILKSLHSKYPDLKIIMEPGSAFMWQTGYLKSYVVDIVENNGIKTAILNVSFTCHMPDCLEMPYWPKVRNAKTFEDLKDKEKLSLPNVYRLGGNSCLSGDYMGAWQFFGPLKIGDEIIFEDMIHYTTVKTNMFNGVNHPSIAIKHVDGTVELLKRFSYSDYENRMD